jgi:hypothetical protein
LPDQEAADEQHRRQQQDPQGEPVDTARSRRQLRDRTREPPPSVSPFEPPSPSWRLPIICAATSEHRARMRSVRASEGCPHDSSAWTSGRKPTVYCEPLSHDSQA